MMITVERVVSRGGSDAAATAKHAERALRVVTAAEITNDASERHEGRRFEYVLARRLIAA
jgi:hypothetical protein